MSDPKDFLARWSRRKREAARYAAEQQELSSRTPEAPTLPSPACGGGEGGGGEGDPGPISPSALTDGSRLSHSTAALDAAVERSAGTTGPELPPLESITAGTDIRPFLAPGVPAELTRAALRRAWAADPAIRDHVGISENSWDFNAAGSMPGFGPLEITDELKQAVDRILDRPPERLQSEDETRIIGTSAGPAHDAAVQTNDESHKSDESPQCNREDAAPQLSTEKDKQIQSIGRDDCGSALPKVRNE